MRRLLPLLLASTLTFAVSLPASGASDRTQLAWPHLADGLAPRVRCERPATLRLRRFEDRSARLECAGRILVRVSVPH